jgi:hypothetical protein
MNDKKEEYKLNFFNFAKGEKIEINIKFTLDNVNKIIDLFQTYSISG